MASGVGEQYLRILWYFPQSNLDLKQSRMEKFSKLLQSQLILKLQSDIVGSSLPLFLNVDDSELQSLTSRYIFTDMENKQPREEV